MKICEIDAAERQADALKFNAVVARARGKELAAKADLAMGQVQQREQRERDEAERRRMLKARKPIGPN